MKYILPISFALFIDGLQAGISFALAGFMGTLGGAVGGALFCSKVLPVALQGGKLTAACAAVGGVVGTAGNVALVPVGIMVGAVINICLSLTMGSALIYLLVVILGWEPVQKYLMPGFVVDTIPGINNLPAWTFLAIASCWRHASQTSNVGFFSNLALSAGRAGAGGIMSLKEQTMNLPGVKESLGRGGFSQERIARPETAEDIETATRSRTPIQDIRSRTPSQKPYAQAA